MNAISGPASYAAISQLLTNAPVRAMRRIPSHDERFVTPQADRYEPASKQDATPSVTYGRSGTSGGAKCS